MTKVDMMRELIALLNRYSDAYYVDDKPLVSDKEYDELYDKLVALEQETGVTMSNSPTVKVQGKVLPGYEKVEHSKPMLSAAKTKDIKEIEKWIDGRDYYVSYKLDGLSLITRYENGKFKQAITRGNGFVGEDVTEQARFISNLPLTIPYDGPLELRGECLMSWEEFNRINETLDEKYTHPRNLAAGTLRNLDTNIIRDRKLSYVVYECITPLEIDDKTSLLFMLNKRLGFEVVPFAWEIRDIMHVSELFDPSTYRYPVDGLVFELQSKCLSEQLGATLHHENCRMALKWADETYETTLRDVIWQVSRTGLLAPVAVFDPVDLDGAMTSRATLHNLSIVEGLELGIGDTITVYRSNMVIPCIDKNLTRSNTLKLPTKCPVCGRPIKRIVSDGGTANLYCTNEDCKSRLIGKLELYVSKYAMNIDGLSTATLETLIDCGLINTYGDLYSLDKYAAELTKLDGFGEKAVQNLLTSIDNSRHTTLERFIVAMGIPNIGRSAAKEIAKCFNGNVKDFINNLAKNFDFTQLDGFGVKADKSIKKWFYDMSKDELANLINCLDFEIIQRVIPDNSAENVVSGKVFAITGKLNHFTRDEINQKIEDLGGKSTDSVSKKCNYLITNTPDSGSSKNKKAQEFGVPIITEDQFIEMIGGL